MNHFSRQTLTLMLLLVAMTTIASAQQDSRLWTDSTGRFKVTATLIESKDGTVQLRTADGKTLNLPINRLSQADQDFLSGGANPFAGGTTDAPMNEVSTLPNSIRPSGGGIGSWSAPKEIDWSQVQELKPRDFAGWNVPAVRNQLSLEVRPGQLKADLIPGEKKHPFLAINVRCKRAAVGFTGTAKDGTVFSRLTLVDFTSGQSVHSQPLVGYFRPAALLDDGNTVVMLGAGSSHKKQDLRDKMQLWKFDGARVTQSASWFPYEKDSKAFGKTSNAAIYEAIPIPGNRLITHASSGRIVLWDIENREPIWFTRGSPEKTGVGITADGKHMAYFDGELLSVVDLSSNQPLGSVSLKGKNVNGWDRVMWSPSGKRILFLSVGSVRMLDVASGNWLHEYQLDANAITTKTWDCPDEDYVLIDGGSLLHVPSKIRVCTYKNSESLQTVAGISFVTAWNRSAGVFKTIDIPHDAATAMLSRAENDPSLFLLHPGVGVAIDVSGIASQYQQEVQTQLQKSMEASGYQVDPSSEIKIVATISEPKQEAVSYIARGSFVVTEYTSSLRLRWNDKELFSRSGTNIPGMLETKRDQTIQQALDEHSRQPSLSFFGYQQFPKFLQKPNADGSASGALMSATITSTGIE
jgi:hypothetical protein